MFENLQNRILPLKKKLQEILEKNGLVSILKDSSNPVYSSELEIEFKISKDKLITENEEEFKEFKEEFTRKFKKKIKEDFRKKFKGPKEEFQEGFEKKFQEEFVKGFGKEFSYIAFKDARNYLIVKKKIGAKMVLENLENPEEPKDPIIFKINHPLGGKGSKNVN